MENFALIALVENLRPSMSDLVIRRIVQHQPNGGLLAVREDTTQLLYTIDPRELTTQLEQAKGNWARAQAAYTGQPTVELWAHGSPVVLAELALTYRCNLSCVFCYAGCQSQPAAGGRSRLRSVQLATM